MRILGIDPALRRTGFGVIDWDGARFTTVSAGTITTGADEPEPERLLKLHDAVGSLIGKFSPDVAVVEKVFSHHGHPATAFILGQARGVICLACAGAHVRLEEYAATRVKKALTGKGMASKVQVQRTVAALLKLSGLPKYLDVTDALALAIAFCYLTKTGILKKRSFGG